jgi:hypothetical protein
VTTQIHSLDLVYVNVKQTTGLRITPSPSLSIARSPDTSHYAIELVEDGGMYDNDSEELFLPTLFPH